ncbi:hypothetical protein DERF_001625 [Dermatophagoides farinae]|uniref:Uncharacterized protein n=1 Tax=Dermatophagoides farinae TaxID=6954 RepID=A0A922L9U2_DERFA|nr:hypothetical protein DERF_001625 [Dermatophagoides farinae]
MGTGGGFDNNEKHLSPVTSSRTNMETVIAAGQTAATGGGGGVGGIDRQLNGFPVTLVGGKTYGMARTERDQTAKPDATRCFYVVSV